MGKTVRSFEGSKKDKMQDRKQARKRKMSLQDFENSPEDQAMDAQEGPGMASGGALKSRGAGVAQRGFDYKIV